MCINAVISHAIASLVVNDVALSLGLFKMSREFVHIASAA